KRSRPEPQRLPSASRTTRPSGDSSTRRQSRRFPSSTFSHPRPRTTMARKREGRCTLDTTAVVYQLHGHTLQQVAVGTAVEGNQVEVPVFVRMEYLRGVVMNLI